MEIKSWDKILPPEALDVRIRVFCQEQGFVDEVDETDALARHLVLFEDGEAVGTCRVFCKNDVFFVGRLAVLKPYRSGGRGRLLLSAAEDAVREMGGTAVRLHAQCQAEGFYAASGYAPFGELDEEQGCPHVWMEKSL